MRSRTIVLYKSKYGSTQKYAEWLAEDLGCEAVPLREIRRVKLGDCDTVIFGGGIYAGRISGLSVIPKNWRALRDKNLFVFTVGLSDPADPRQFDESLRRALSPEQRAKIRTFHLRGAIDCDRLSFTHRAIMKMVKKMTANKPADEQTGEERAILESFGGTVDYTDRAALEPIARWVKRL